MYMYVTIFSGFLLLRSPASDSSLDPDKKKNIKEIAMALRWDNPFRNRCKEKCTFIHVRKIPVCGSIWLLNFSVTTGQKTFMDGGHDSHAHFNRRTIEEKATNLATYDL